MVVIICSVGFDAQGCRKFCCIYHDIFVENLLGEICRDRLIFNVIDIVIRHALSVVTRSDVHLLAKYAHNLWHMAL